MEIFVSVFSAVVAMSCLFAVVKSDLKDKKSRSLQHEAKSAESES